MGQILINDYLKQLDIIKKVSGTRRETVVREAFKDLLKVWGKQHNLPFIAEYPLKTATKTNIEVDGAGPVQGKETQGPDHPREVRHLPICRLPGKSHRPADAGDGGERGDSQCGGGHEGSQSLVNCLYATSPFRVMGRAVSQV